jgi:hypothetical protein
VWRPVGDEGGVQPDGIRRDLALIVAHALMRAAFTLV